MASSRGLRKRHHFIVAVHDAPILDDDTATVVEDDSVIFDAPDNDVFRSRIPTVIGPTAEDGTATVSAVDAP